RTSSSPAPTPAENVLPPSTPCSALPGSTDSTPNSISTTFWSASQTIPSRRSTTSCPGISHPTHPTAPELMYPHNAMWIHNSHTSLTNGQHHTLTLLKQFSAFHISFPSLCSCRR